jgi:hypothetical protein
MSATAGRCVYSAKLSSRRAIGRKQIAVAAAIVTSQANATRQSGNFANQLSIPLAQLYTAEARPPGCRSSSCFSNEFNMVNVENGKQKAQEQADEKVFLAFGLCRGAHPK